MSLFTSVLFLRATSPLTLRWGCPSIKYQADFLLQGMKYGPAASHGVEVHNTQPYEVSTTKQSSSQYFLSAYELLLMLFHEHTEDSVCYGDTMMCRYVENYSSSDQGEWVEVEEGFFGAPALLHLC